MRQRGWRLGLKRLVDLLTAGVLVAALAVPMLLTALAVRVRLGTPVLFRQERPGRGTRPFVFLKFRTMTDAVDATGLPLPDEARLTTLGRWLRATSLDELPQLFNVLQGDMSLVGPRPLLTKYLPRYTRAQAQRHDVLPGITGWAQVHGRNAIDWTRKLELDTWYVEHWSLILDARVLWRTCRAVWRREGIAAPGHATAPEFIGSDPSRSASGGRP
jgi:lipopolysaccharide/colanic/teichoic acid biosynthesis glycosyltransferase